MGFRLIDLEWPWMA